MEVYIEGEEGDQGARTRRRTVREDNTMRGEVRGEMRGEL
jgi:hypothetical protein